MKFCILIIGPKPPPYHGVSVVTNIILDSGLGREFNLLHLDTSDRRALANIGRLDFSNVYLALKHLVQLISMLHKFSPIIVYLPICQTIKGLIRDAAFIFFSRIKGAKVVVHLHGGYFRTLYERSSTLVKFMIRYSCKFVSQAIVLGESLRHIFEGLVPSERIAVVANGIDRNYITETELSTKHYALSSNNLHPSAFRILFLSNLTLSKGFFDVIKSIPIITQKNISSPNIEFIFAGEFWEGEKTKEEIFQYINSHNLNLYIKFTGTTISSKKKDLLLSSSLFVLPTYYLYEGQPVVIIEAMAAGLPIITTNQGCIKEMVIDGENGFIIEKKNPEKIAEKIIYLLKNEKVRREMGKKSRERFLKYYTKDRFINSLSKVFDEVLAET